MTTTTNPKSCMKVTSRLKYIDHIEDPVDGDAHLDTHYEVFDANGNLINECKTGCLMLESDYNKFWNGVDYKLIRGGKVLKVVYLKEA